LTFSQPPASSSRPRGGPEDVEFRAYWLRILRDSCFLVTLARHGSRPVLRELPSQSPPSRTTRAESMPAHRERRQGSPPHWFVADGLLTRESLSLMISSLCSDFPVVALPVPLQDNSPSGTKTLSRLGLVWSRERCSLDGRAFVAARQSAAAAGLLSWLRPARSFTLALVVPA
jgi:hypothetical protein